MSASPNTHLVQSIYAAFGRGDLPAILAVLDENVLWRHPRGGTIPWGGERIGRDSVAQFFAELIDHVEVLRFEPRSFVAEHNTVVVTGAEEMRVRSTGNSYTVEWIHVWTLRDGRIVEFTEFTDTAAIEEAFRKA